MAGVDELLERVARLERQTVLAEAHFGEAFWKALDVAYDATLPFRQLRCIVCGRAAEWGAWERVVDHCMFGGGKLERYRCPDCDCLFGPQKYLDLDEGFVSRDYRLLYSRYSEGDSTSNEVRTFQSLNPVRTGPYLDWGCGAWSRTIETLRDSGYDVWGFEPSADAAGNFVVSQRGAIALRFVGLFSNNVIEHFRDPVAQFREFRALLKDGGSMAHSSPCYEYSYAFTRFHTLFLLGRSPRVLAELTGFKVKEQVRDGEYINFVFTRAGDA